MHNCGDENASEIFDGGDGIGELRSAMLGAGSHNMDDVGVEGSGVGGITDSHQSDEDDWSGVLSWCFSQCSRAKIVPSLCPGPRLLSFVCIF